jgi:hypothetical protein
MVSTMGAATGIGAAYAVGAKVSTMGAAIVVIGIGAAYAVGAMVSIMGAAMVVIGIGAAYAAGDAYAVGAKGAAPIIGAGAMSSVTAPPYGPPYAPGKVVVPNIVERNISNQS